MLCHRGQNLLQIIANPALVLNGQLVIRTDNHGQIGVPQLHCLLIRYVRHICRAFLAVSCIELGNHISHKPGCLSADISLLVHEKLIEEA